MIQYTMKDSGQSQAQDGDVSNHEDEINDEKCILDCNNNLQALPVDNSFTPDVQTILSQQTSSSDRSNDNLTNDNGDSVILDEDNTATANNPPPWYGAAGYIPYYNSYIGCSNGSPHFAYPLLPNVYTPHGNWPGFCSDQSEGCVRYWSLSDSTSLGPQTNPYFYNYCDSNNTGRVQFAQQADLPLFQNSSLPLDSILPNNISQSYITLPLPITVGSSGNSVTTDQSTTLKDISRLNSIHQNVLQQNFPAVQSQQGNYTSSNLLPTIHNDGTISEHHNGNLSVKPTAFMNRRYSLPSHCLRSPNASSKSTSPVKSDGTDSQSFNNRTTEKTRSYSERDRRTMHTGIFNNLSKSYSSNSLFNANSSDHNTAFESLERTHFSSYHNSLFPKNIFKNLLYKSNSASAGKSFSEHSSGPKVSVPQNLMKQYNCYLRLDLPPECFGKPQLLSTHSHSPRGVEGAWRGHMSLLFRNLHEPWLLSRAPQDFVPRQSWCTYKDVAKVRFYCQNCNDGWTSMNGVVVFYYRHRDSSTVMHDVNYRNSNGSGNCGWNSSNKRGASSGWGEVLYQVAGQKCGRCNPDIYEMPLWYSEEAQKVITNLYYDIAQRVYGLCTPTPIRTRRLGQPQQHYSDNRHHNASLCEGCVYGVCMLDTTTWGATGNSRNDSGNMQGKCDRYHHHHTSHNYGRVSDDKFPVTKVSNRAAVSDNVGKNIPLSSGLQIPHIHESEGPVEQSYIQNQAFPTKMYQSNTVYQHFEKPQDNTQCQEVLCGRNGVSFPMHPPMQATNRRRRSVDSLVSSRYQTNTEVGNSIDWNHQQFRRYSIGSIRNNTGTANYRVSQLNNTLATTVMPENKKNFVNESKCNTGIPDISNYVLSSQDINCNQLSLHPNRLLGLGENVVKEYGSCPVSFSANANFLNDSYFKPISHYPYQTMCPSTAVPLYCPPNLAINNEATPLTAVDLLPYGNHASHISYFPLNTTSLPPPYLTPPEGGISPQWMEYVPQPTANSADYYLTNNATPVEYNIPPPPLPLPSSCTYYPNIYSGNETVTNACAQPSVSSSNLPLMNATALQCIGNSECARAGFGTNAQYSFEHYSQNWGTANVKTNNSNPQQCILGPINNSSQTTDVYPPEKISEYEVQQP